MDAIEINPEFKKLCPPLRKSERELLERSIIAEGCRDPLVLWDNILIDGHNRYDICTQHGIEYQTVSMSFDSTEAARQWILTNQMSRRNLSQIQESYLRGCYYRLVRKSNGGWREGRTETESGKNEPTQNVLAKVFAVSPSTIRTDVWIADAIDKLPPASREFVFDPDTVTRKQHVIDLSNVAAKLQPKVIEAAKKSGGEGLRTVMCQLRGKALPGAHGVRCKKCGARLAPGVQTCLSCDLSEQEIGERLSQPLRRNYSSTVVEYDDDEIQARVASIRRAKESGSQIAYYAKEVHDYVKAGSLERNTPEHRACANLYKVLREHVGPGKFRRKWDDPTLTTEAT